METTEITKRRIERRSPPPVEFDYEVRFRGVLLTDVFDECDSRIVQNVVDEALELECVATRENPMIDDRSLAPPPTAQMRKPLLLDLFCGAGGCSVGYARAGFEVVGVDINPQPNYPFEFHQADALEFPVEGFDAIHASPPCQSYSRAMKHLAKAKPMLIDEIRNRLISSGRPWVIENVEGAPIPTGPTLDGRFGVMLCGTEFELRVYRHRLFETSFPVYRRSVCDHTRLAVNPHNEAGRNRIRMEFPGEKVDDVYARAMGLDWTMTRPESREAVPPAYTEFIGHQLMQHLKSPATPEPQATQNGETNGTD